MAGVLDSQESLHRGSRLASFRSGSLDCSGPFGAKSQPRGSTGFWVGTLDQCVSEVVSTSSVDALAATAVEFLNDDFSLQ